MLNLASSGTLAQTTASVLRVDFNGTYAANGEGGALFIDDDGVASSTNYSVYVNSNAVNCMKLETANVGFSTLVLEPATNATASTMIVDGSANGWIGAADTGMVHIQDDLVLASTAATLLYVGSTGQPADGAHGFMARFVDTGTARTSAHGVEIKTKNTTPALSLNNQLTIAGADSAGVLMAITGIDTTGYSDTVTIDHSGSGSALVITSTETDSVGLEVVPKAAQTVSSALYGSSTATFLGADDVGMVNIRNASSGAHAGTPLLMVYSSGARQASAEGFLARFVDVGDATAGAYAVEIETTATTGGLHSTAHCTFDRGWQSGSVAITAGATDGTTNVCPDGVRHFTVTSAGATSIIILPTPTIGTEVWLTNTGGTGYELRTSTPASIGINTGTGSTDAESAVASTAIMVKAVCTAATTWVATQFSASGAETALEASASG